MIDPVSIANERVGDSAQVEQPIPIGVVASQARDFKPKTHVDTTERYFGCQVREAGAFGQAGTGDAEVLVDDRYILAVPSQFYGALGQLNARAIRDDARSVMRWIRVRR